jgi:GH43 family beta-xylosidase
MAVKNSFLRFSFFSINLLLVTSQSTFENPVLPTGADPWVLKHNNTYYMTHTWDNADDRIAIYKTSEMSELSSVAPVTVWMAPSTGPYSKHIWAPEIHFYDGKFYLYFAGDDGDIDHHRVYVLENSSPDPTFGTWVMKGTTNSYFPIPHKGSVRSDASVFR